jgi:Fe2+ transport system protein B
MSKTWKKPTAFTQIKDLEIPSILVNNMADRMEHKGITLDILFEEHLKQRLPSQFEKVLESKSWKKIIVTYKQFLQNRAWMHLESILNIL